MLGPDPSMSKGGDPLNPRALRAVLGHEHPMQRWIVVRESPDWTGRRLARLEPDSNPPEPCPPDPATTVLIMLDIDPGWPIVTPRFLLSR
jgi:hypothetical protein